MKRLYLNSLEFVLIAIFLCTLSFSVVAEDQQDILYITDFSGNTVERFDANTGVPLGALVSAATGGLAGPNGIIVNGDDMTNEVWVANQNVGQPFNGDIRRYDQETGAFDGALVPTNDPNGPLAPDGLVLFDHKTLFVADVGDFDGQTETPGNIGAFNAENGDFLGNLIPTGYGPILHARGLVIGPDEKLYVSTRNLTSPLGGDVLRFDPETFEFLGVFVSSATCNCDLNRPDGLVFGPDGRLYVTSFRADPNDNDKILIFNGKTGEYIDKIDLDQVGQDRAFAQAILFGPGRKLYVPIAGFGPDTGSVRAYNVKNKTFKTFVPAGSTLKSPRYLSFGKTNPATLGYSD